MLHVSTFVSLCLLETDVPSSAQARPDVVTIDTSNVLFILSGAFVGLDSVIRKRVVKGVSVFCLRDSPYLIILQSMGFTAPLAPSASRENSNTVTPFFTPNSNPLSNMLDLVEPAGMCYYYIIQDIADCSTASRPSRIRVSWLLN